MDIKSNHEKHTVTWLKSQDMAGKLNKNISIQRREVWDAVKKSNLIVSLLLSVPLESLLLEESEKKSHNVLDGKQRTLTLCAFVNDEFALSPKIRVKEIDGSPLVGMKFSMLPEELQSRIMEYELSISVLRPLESEERAMVFLLRNQAVPLSKMDLSLVMLGERAMDTFAMLCDHNFMQNKIKLTAPARRKHDDLSVLLQYMILRSRPETGFSGAEIMSFCDDIKNEETDIPADEITAMLDYLDEAISEKRAYLKKVHIPVVFYVAQLATEKDIVPEEFGLRLDAFFENQPDDGEYMAACRSGSAKRTNVQTRVQIMSGMLDGLAPEKKEVPDDAETEVPSVPPEKKPRGRKSESKQAV
jgi:hypothetical protein